MLLHICKLYVTYRKYNKTNDLYYVGRSSGWVKKVNLKSADKIVKRRDNNHHKNKEGYSPAALDKFSTNKEAIRGREQSLIEKYKTEGKSGNIYNGISPRNKNREIYLKEALRIFGDILLVLIVLYLFNMI